MKPKKKMCFFLNRPQVLGTIFKGKLRFSIIKVTYNIQTLRKTLATTKLTGAGRAEAEEAAQWGPSISPGGAVLRGPMGPPLPCLSPLLVLTTHLGVSSAR